MRKVIGFIYRTVSDDKYGLGQLADGNMPGVSEALINLCQQGKFHFDMIKDGRMMEMHAANNRICLPLQNCHSVSQDKLVKKVMSYVVQHKLVTKEKVSQAAGPPHMSSSSSANYMPLPYGNIYMSPGQPMGYGGFNSPLGTKFNFTQQPPKQSPGMYGNASYGQPTTPYGSSMFSKPASPYGAGMPGYGAPSQRYGPLAHQAFAASFSAPSKKASSKYANLQQEDESSDDEGPVASPLHRHSKKSSTSAMPAMSTMPAMPAMPNMPAMPMTPPPSASSKKSSSSKATPIKEEKASNKSHQSANKVNMAAFPGLMSPPLSKKGKKKAKDQAISTKEPALSLADFLRTPTSPAPPRADVARIPVPANATTSAAPTAGSVTTVADLEATLRGCSLQQSEIDRILGLKREAERAGKDKADNNAAGNNGAGNNIAAAADITLVKNEDTSDDSSSSDDSNSDSDSDCDEKVSSQRQAFDHFTKYLALLQQQAEAKKAKKEAKGKKFKPESQKDLVEALQFNDGAVEWKDGKDYDGFVKAKVAEGKMAIATASGVAK